MDDDVFAVYCDGKSHFVRGGNTAEVLAKVHRMHPEAEEVRMIRCKTLPEAARVVRYRYWPMVDEKKGIKMIDKTIEKDAMRRISYMRMVDFVKDLDDGQLTEEQRRFRNETIEMDKDIRCDPSIDCTHIVEVPFSDDNYDIIKTIVTDMSERMEDRITIPEFVQKMCMKSIYIVFERSMGASQ